MVVTVKKNKEGRDIDREKKKSGGEREKRCIFPERDREPSCGITGSQRVMGGSGPRYQNMEPPGRSLWSAHEKRENGESGYCLMWVLQLGFFS